MTNYDTYLLHAILYAKGHYEEDRKMTGLRKILSLYSGCDASYVSDEDLLHFALKLLEMYAPTTSVRNMIFSTFKEAWMWRRQRRLFKDPKRVTRLDFVQSILKELRHISIDKLPTLPVADVTIAPLKKN